ncbi:helix-turn-helix transcriptional regulator [Emticicia sp. C21]|uniref:AraC family transcriptional regulator n=1 Tax=Emticicia sp. C21 TaxID=2302915 RepID=UPI000E34B1EB|nr:helix-turn-helix domain-containing protein [Emticicia sp. C21]RFS16673.1 helix-turn-helix domain-containing protein [Emticicia sp. C21]
MPSLTKIPIHQQQITAIGGVDVLHMIYQKDEQTINKLNEHRDEYYSLAIGIKGTGAITCDMESISVRPKSIMLIKPYQVHSIEIISKDAEAYFISIAPFLVPEFCRNIFENTAVSEQSMRLSNMEMKSILQMAEVLHQAFNAGNPFKAQITNHLLNALIIHIAALFLASQQKQGRKRNQAFSITQQFKELVSEHSFLHIASFYADKLHITTSHLNDCVKATIGLSVTQFLQQAMLLEAKRSLYYTNTDVKKISFDLGFEDHTYFSRLFKKLTNETPLSFRNKFRE